MATVRRCRNMKGCLRTRSLLTERKNCLEKSTARFSRRRTDSKPYRCGISTFLDLDKTQPPNTAAFWLYSYRPSFRGGGRRSTVTVYSRAILHMYKTSSKRICSHAKLPVCRDRPS